MRHITATLSLIAALLSVAPAQRVLSQGPVRSAETAPAIPQAGDRAPDFNLPSQSGTTTSLTSLKGKWVVLYFYPEDMTSGCTMEAHNFQRDADKFAAKNAVIVGVSVDSVDSHKQFCAKEGLNIKLLSDTNRTVVARYGSLNQGSNMAQRNTFLISPEGKIVKVWTRVNPSRHSTEVLETLNDPTKS